MTSERYGSLLDFEIQQYLNRFERMSAEELLEIMGQLREFFYEHMTSEGRKFMEKEKSNVLKRFLSRKEIPRREGT